MTVWRTHSGVQEVVPRADTAGRAVFARPVDEIGHVSDSVTSDGLRRRHELPHATDAVTSERVEGGARCALIAGRLSHARRSEREVQSLNRRVLRAGVRVEGAAVEPSSSRLELKGMILKTQRKVSARALVGYFCVLSAGLADSPGASHPRAPRG